MEGERPERVVWTYDKTPSVLFGAGATEYEKNLTLLATVGVPLLLVGLHWRHLPEPWAWWQWVVAVIIAADIGGGVVANALNAQKRAVHSPVRPADSAFLKAVKRWPWLFPALHIHPFVIVWCFGGDMAWAAIWYFVPLGVSQLLPGRDLYTHRPLAFLLLALAVPITLYGPPTPVGMEWFVPLYLLKLVYGHGVREEPYAP